MVCHIDHESRAHSTSFYYTQSSILPDRVHKFGTCLSRVDKRPAPRSSPLVYRKSDVSFRCICWTPMPALWNPRFFHLIHRTISHPKSIKNWLAQSHVSIFMLCLTLCWAQVSSLSFPDLAVELKANDLCRAGYSLSRGTTASPLLFRWPPSLGNTVLFIPCFQTYH